METEAEVRFALDGLPMPLTLRPVVPMSDDKLLRFCSANKGYQIEREPDGSLSINAPKGARAQHSSCSFHGQGSTTGPKKTIAAGWSLLTSA